MEYHFIAINFRSILSSSGSTDYGPIFGPNRTIYHLIVWKLMTIVKMN